MTVRVSIAEDDVPQHVVVNEICDLNIYNTNPFISNNSIGLCEIVKGYWKPVIFTKIDKNLALFEIWHCQYRKFFKTTCILR